MLGCWSPFSISASSLKRCCSALVSLRSWEVRGACQVKLHERQHLLWAVQELCHVSLLRARKHHEVTWHCALTTWTTRWWKQHKVAAVLRQHPSFSFIKHISTASATHSHYGGQTTTGHSRNPIHWHKQHPSGSRHSHSIIPLLSTGA